MRHILKHLDELCASGRNVELCAVVDCVNAKDAATARVAKLKASPELLFVEPFTGALPIKVEVELNRLAERLGINAVIVATRPMSDT